MRLRRQSVEPERTAAMRPGRGDPTLSLRAKSRHNIPTMFTNAKPPAAMRCRLASAPSGIKRKLAGTDGTWSPQGRTDHNDAAYHKPSCRDGVGPTLQGPHSAAGDHGREPCRRGDRHRERPVAVVDGNDGGRRGRCAADRVSHRNGYSHAAGIGARGAHLSACACDPSAGCRSPGDAPASIAPTIAAASEAGRTDARAAGPLVSQPRIAVEITASLRKRLCPAGIKRRVARRAHAGGLLGALRMRRGRKGRDSEQHKEGARKGTPTGSDSHRCTSIIRCCKPCRSSPT